MVCLVIFSLLLIKLWLYYLCLISQPNTISEALDAVIKNYQTILLIKILISHSNIYILVPFLTNNVSRELIHRMIFHVLKIYFYTISYNVSRMTLGIFSALGYIY